jgi:hypothetical protein
MGGIEILNFISFLEYSNAFLEYNNAFELLKDI